MTNTLGSVAKATAFQKIEKCIISAKNPEQIKGCYKMIKNFKTLFNDQSASEELNEFARDIFDSKIAV